MVTVSDIYNKLSEYEKDNYYLKDEQGNALKPELICEGWEKLTNGRQVEMDEKTYKALKEGKDPLTQEQLVQAGVNGERRPGWNLTFSPHKSFTVLSHSSPEHAKIINDIHNKAVSDVMRYFEGHLAQVRQCSQGVVEPVKTGNILAMRVDHSVNRDGDIQKHTHVVIFNQSYNEQSGKWQALHSDAFHSDILTKIYNNQLAHYAKEHGLPVEWVKSDSGRTEYAAIAGIPDKAIEITSERAKQIDEYVQNHRDELKAKYPNAGEGELKQIAAIETRQAKQVMTHDEIQQRFENKLAEAGLAKEHVVDSVYIAKADYDHSNAMNEYEVVRTATNSLADYQSAFSHQDIMRASAEIAKGDVSINDIQRAIELEMKDEVIKLSDSHIIEDRSRNYADSIFTTKEVLKAERHAVKAIREGIDGVNVIIDKAEAVKAINEYEERQRQGNTDFKLTESQRNAVEFFLTNTDKFNAVQGYAGTGKTTVMKAIREISEQHGYRLLGISETNVAVNEMKAAGIENAMTVAKFLQSSKAQNELNSKTIILSDESSFIGAKNFDKIINIAEKTGARASFWGDKDQLPAVSAGSPFSYAVENKVINYAELKDIVRQIPERYKEAVKDTINKDIDKAFSKFEIHEVSKDDLITKTADIYMKADGYTNSIVSTQTNKDRDAINTEIRNKLIEQGKVDSNSEKVSIYASKNLTGSERFNVSNYGIGDKIIVNESRAGVKVGAELTITKIDTANHIITATGKDRKGNEVEKKIDIRRHGDKFNVYEQKQIDLAKGDKVIFNQTDKETGIANSDIAYIKSIAKDESGNIKNITFNYQGKDVISNTRHFEHGYAQTVYKSQGKTSQDVIYHAPTSTQKSYQEFYVSMTRGRQEAKIVTDDKERLKEQVSKVYEKETTYKYTKGIDREISKLEKQLQKADSEQQRKTISEKLNAYRDIKASAEEVKKYEKYTKKLSSKDWKDLQKPATQKDIEKARGLKSFVVSVKAKYDSEQGRLTVKSERLLQALKDRVQSNLKTAFNKFLNPENFGDKSYRTQKRTYDVYLKHDNGQITKTKQVTTFETKQNGFYQRYESLTYMKNGDIYRHTIERTGRVTKESSELIRRPEQQKEQVRQTTKQTEKPKSEMQKSEAVKGKTHNSITSKAVSYEVAKSKMQREVLSKMQSELYPRLAGKVELMTDKIVEKMPGAKQVSRTLDKNEFSYNKTLDLMKQREQALKDGDLKKAGKMDKEIKSEMSKMTAQEKQKFDQMQSEKTKSQNQKMQGKVDGKLQRQGEEKQQGKEGKSGYSDGKGGK